MTFGPNSPHGVRLPVMRHEWRSLTFLHWRCDPELIRPRLPATLELDLFEGSAWLSLTPFVLSVRPPLVGRLPGGDHVPETNLRTYVRGPRGPGIWFFSLDVAAFWVLFGGRNFYGVPYYWSDMKVQEGAHTITYESARRWPGSPASAQVEVELGEPYAAAELGERDHFLSARWRLYGLLSDRLVTARVTHEPWPLQRARILELEESLTAAAAVPPPAGDLIVQHSPGVSVTLGPPAPVMA